MPASTITVKGQTTIPKKIREYLKLQPGDRVDFIIENGGKVVLEPSTLDVMELEGVLYKPGIKALSIEDMKKAMKKHLKRRPI
jgi:antitoxin PrlF